MIYYLYEIKNNVNGKIYVGVHETEILPDTYMGSGRLIRQAIRKYGISNFSKTILETFKDRESAYLKESEVVTQEFINRHDTYNLALGGTGGSINQNRKPFTGKHSEETRDLISKKSKGRLASSETKAKMRANSWAVSCPDAQREHARKAASRPRISLNRKEYTSEERSTVSRNFKEYFRLHGHPAKGLKRQKIKCPHCDKEGAKHVMNRFHFDNCKCKQLIILSGGSVESAQDSVKI